MRLYALAPVTMLWGVVLANPARLSNVNMSEPTSTPLDNATFRPPEATVQIQMGNLTGSAIIDFAIVEATSSFVMTSPAIPPPASATGFSPNTSSLFTTSACPNTTGMIAGNMTSNFNVSTPSTFRSFAAPTSVNDNLSVVTGGSIPSQPDAAYLFAVLCVMFGVGC